MHSYKIGGVYYFSCITWNWIGRVVSVTATDILLEPGAARVFNEGKRFNEFLRQGPGPESEIELAAGATIINRNAVNDATEWALPVPKASI